MSLRHKKFSAYILVASLRDAKKSNGWVEIWLCEQAACKTKKERESPNICLSLRGRFRRKSSTLRRLLCWRRQRHSVYGTKKETKKHFAFWHVTPSESYFYCRYCISRNEPDWKCLSYSSHRNDKKKLYIL